MKGERGLAEEGGEELGEPRGLGGSRCPIKQTMWATGMFRTFLSIVGRLLRVQPYLWSPGSREARLNEPLKYLFYPLFVILRQELCNSH